MGRAMIIICAGVLVSMGYVGFGSSQQIKNVVGSNASYAEQQRAKNAAYTVIQMAMKKMSENETWKDDNGDDSPWIKTVEDTEVELFVETVEEGEEYFDPDVIRIHTKAKYYDPVTEEERETEIINTYLTSAIEEYVPDFEGALTLTGEANVSASGSSSIRGNDASNTCSDKPGVTVASESMKEHVEDNAGDKIESGGVNVKDDLNYDPTSEMIARLKSTGDYTEVTSDIDYFGSESDPGIFVVEDQVKLTGKPPNGYGILIIQSDAELAMEDEEGNSLWVGGNWEFNGLIIFENAMDFTGRGTPSINGSVLVGNTDDYTGDPIDVDFNGNINLQYDCAAEKLARQAAANAVGYKRYVRTSTFE